MGTITDKTLLITGANRGIGRALVDEALRRGARRVYAGMRRAAAHPDQRVTPLLFDTTDPARIADAARGVDQLDVLVNNAGIALYDDLTDRALIERHLAVNVFGTFDVTRAFLPALLRSGGAVLNIVSVGSLAPLQSLSAYSMSKAAAFSLTQALRTQLAAQGIRVHAVLPGPVDTEMTCDLHIPKASPESVARAILDGFERDEDEIFPDPMSETVADGWRAGVAKELERQFSTLATTGPAVA